MRRCTARTQWFQSTRPRGARRTGLASRSSSATLFQSTRPRGARRQPHHALPLLDAVSIHAPTRGATRMAATALGASSFQSTRPRGARQQLQIMRRCRSGCFNPRAHAGRDNHCDQRRIAASAVFQSTRPRGARPGYVAASLHDDRFNPRAHAGRDDCRRLLSIGNYVSIHAPTRGATLTRDAALMLLSVSIHAPTRGATTASCVSSDGTASFQSTRPRGARRARADMLRRHSSFNPRAHAGRDALQIRSTG